MHGWLVLGFGFCFILFWWMVLSCRLCLLFISGDLLFARRSDEHSLIFLHGYIIRTVKLNYLCIKGTRLILNQPLSWLTLLFNRLPCFNLISYWLHLRKLDDFIIHQGLLVLYQFLSNFDLLFTCLIDVLVYGLVLDLFFRFDAMILPLDLFLFSLFLLLFFILLPMNFWRYLLAWDLPLALILLPLFTNDIFFCHFVILFIFLPLLLLFLLNQLLLLLYFYNLSWPFLTEAIWILFNILTNFFYLLNIYLSSILFSFNFSALSLILCQNTLFFLFSILN